ncbi:MAG: molybdopterin molybdenumtransferase MoeA [Alphaproteobacteria bacterium]|nr:molybdopterin molybdenumtransferase MoeA [Alphaproteobacteria bacterium]
MIRMASVEQALELILQHGEANLAAVETVPLEKAEGRVLAAPVVAAISQPPAAVSAMDGYAVRFSDMKVGHRLRIKGESSAGHPYDNAIDPGEAVRIFTGAHVPPGADHILIQEDARREGEVVEVAAAQTAPGSIRRKGRDFNAGDELVPAGHRITAGAIALIAAGNVPAVDVRVAPRIGVLANGDELVAPGSSLKAGEIVNSVAPAVMSLIRQWGAEPVDLGVASDAEADVRKRIAEPCDILLTIGGASVGDHDVVRAAFAKEGFEGIFEKVAVKPGKPTWFSSRGGQLVLGLPGNPAAAMVTSRLFLKPLIEARIAALRAPAALMMAHAQSALPATGGREEYLRAVVTLERDGHANVRPADDQDSSLISPFLSANALIHRLPRAPEAAAGDLVEVIWL